MQIEVEVRYTNTLTEIERRLAVPLVEIAQQFVPGMLARINRGQAPVGLFSALGAHSKPTPAHGLFWVSPKQRQPSGWIAKADTGPWAGWAAYKTYKDYCRALGSPPRDFFQTGELMRSLRIRATGPARAKISFYGTHSIDAASQRKPRSGEHWVTQKIKRRPNAQVAYLASRHERQALLTPSRQELEVVARLLQNEVTARLLDEASAGQRVSRLRQRLGRVQKRLAAARGR